MLRIISAAVRIVRTDTNEQITLECHRHCDAFKILKDLRIPFDKNTAEQGFIAYSEENGEEFVDRVTAFNIALNSGQIPPQNTSFPTALYSEDLW